MRHLAIVMVLVVPLAGCGGNVDPLGRVQVSGKVSVGGQPLKQGSISFEPQGTGKTSSGGMVENGVFTLPVSNGLAPGDYLVRISATEGGPAAGDAPSESTEVAKELIPPEFNSNSTQKITIKKEVNNDFKFEIPAAIK